MRHLLIGLSDGKNKKGILSFNFVAMIPRIFFLVIVLTAVIVLVELYMNQKFNTEDMRAEIMINGFIYATGGINYYDPVTGRTYPEIIDLAQMNATELEDSFFFKNNNVIAAKIHVSQTSYYEYNHIKEIYYNKEWFDSWEPLMRLKIPGIGGVSEYTRTLPAIYRKENGELNSGYVTYQVVQPK
ncbi:MAG: hypothetical protein V1729_01790 [Candidatus Woesearchaeota archaeon]